MLFFPTGSPTCKSTNSGKATKLRENLRRKASGNQASHHTGSNTEHTQHITHTGSRLRGESRKRTNAEKGADKVTGLDDTASAGSGSSDESTSA